MIEFFVIAAVVLIIVFAIGFFCGCASEGKSSRGIISSYSEILNNTHRLSNYKSELIWEVREALRKYDEKTAPDDEEEDEDEDE